VQVRDACESEGVGTGKGMGTGEGVDMGEGADAGGRCRRGHTVSRNTVN
jgi:hypothetical protein